MKQSWFTVLGGGVGVIAFGASAFAQANNCPDATTLTLGTVSGTTVGATPDGAGCFASSPDVWYKFTSPGFGRLVFETCGFTQGIDTVLAVYSGCPGNAGTLLACSDDNCDFDARLTLSAVPGTTYYLRVSSANAASGAFKVSASMGDFYPASHGPDVIVGELNGVTAVGNLGAVRAYAVGTTSCNVGDAPLNWIDDVAEHPVIGQNMYRLKDGKFEQIGMSWLKHGFTALAENTCGTCIPPPQLGRQLGIHCSDPYTAGLNAVQSGLGPRSHVNATQGTYPYPFWVAHAGYIVPPGIGDNITRRLQVLNADALPAQNPGARYWVEGQYVTHDDAQAGNALNNASYREVSLFPQTVFLGPTVQMKAAIYAWKDADPLVDIQVVDAMEDGRPARFLVASRVTANTNGTWTYVYAVQNFNSDRSASAFRVRRGQSTLTSPTVRDVFYHSGEIYDGTDWAFSASGADGVWACAQTFAQNPNANALRWGTMSTFSFVADQPPAWKRGGIDLFKPGAGPDLSLVTQAPRGGPCPTDLDDGSGSGTSDGGVTIDDLVYFLDRYAAGSLESDLDDGSGTGVRDAGVTIDDLVYYLDRFAQGC